MHDELSAWIERSSESLAGEALKQVREVSASLAGVVSIRQDVADLLRAVPRAGQADEEAEMAASVNRIGRHWLSLGIPVEDVVRALLRFDQVLMPALWREYEHDPERLRTALQLALFGLNRLVYLFTQLHTRRQERILAGQIAAIEAQQEELRRMSVPVIEIWDDVVMLPLIGTLDSARGHMLMEGLLQRISAKRARYVILDVTGVTEMDSNVAALLIQTVQAARLVGARTLLVGVSPMMAQTLVDLNIDLPDTETVVSLRAGLERVIRRLGYTITGPLRGRTATSGRQSPAESPAEA